MSEDKKLHNKRMNGNLVNSISNCEIIWRDDGKFDAFGFRDQFHSECEKVRVLTEALKEIRKVVDGTVNAVMHESIYVKAVNLGLLIMKVDLIAKNTLYKVKEAE